MASDWTHEHYVTRRSEHDGDVHRCWLTCRCGWSSGDLPDGNIPTTHRAELEHYRAVVEDARGWEYAIRAKEGIIAAGYDNIVVAEFDAAMATEDPSGDLEVVRRHPASEWEACE